ncbi:hypothetical protein O988_07900 [Pseudogymnoascus sp. VKM F-3808]|nr:hypothetical protein O988_07900 [Pseudogymnoascus sp. VKM F-3808]
MAHYEDMVLTASNKNAANFAYRVRGIPIDYRQKQVKVLLQTLLHLDKAGDSVILRSIAISPNRKTKVATVCFRCRPILLPPRPDGEWHFPIPTDNNSENSSADDDDDIIRQEQIVTVDSHFKGITVLRSFSKLDEHKIDIIAISGLRGHAFGSFEARDGKHMWLCDSLPRDLPGAQIMIYGYDTQLDGSISFQDLESLASSLRASIAAQRMTGSINAKSRAVPLVFIAHGLGGLIVKEAIIQMKKDKKHHDLLQSIYGALFFGVPNQGMEIASLVPMVAGQPNQALLHSLGKESQLLRNQFREFPEAFDSKDSEIFCYYETEMSRTAILTENNVWKMDGPRCILVDSSSARHTRPWENEAHNCMGMKREHSMLVKFSPNDSDYDQVLAKLKSMMAAAVRTRPRDIRVQLELKQLIEIEKRAIENNVGKGKIKEGTALQLAAKKGNEQLLRLLLQAGANVNSGGGGYDGDALQMAASNGNEQVVQLLLDAGANAESEATDYSRSGLQVAANYGHEQVIQLLLDAGADVNSTGGHYGSALEGAVQHGHSDISQRLRPHGAKEVEA